MMDNTQSPESDVPQADLSEITQLKGILLGNGWGRRNMDDDERAPLKEPFKPWPEGKPLRRRREPTEQPAAEERMAEQPAPEEPVAEEQPTTEEAANTAPPPAAAPVDLSQANVEEIAALAGMSPADELAAAMQQLAPVDLSQVNVEEIAMLDGMPPADELAAAMEQLAPQMNAPAPAPPPGEPLPPTDDATLRDELYVQWRGLSQAQNVVLVAMLGGMQITEAAVMAGVHRNTVHRWLRGHGAFRTALSEAQMEVRTAALTELHQGVAAATGCLIGAIRKGDSRAAAQLLRGLGFLKNDQPLRDPYELAAIETPRRRQTPSDGAPPPAAPRRVIGVNRIFGRAARKLQAACAVALLGIVGCALGCVAGIFACATGAVAMLARGAREVRECWSTAFRRNEHSQRSVSVASATDASRLKPELQRARPVNSQPTNPWPQRQVALFRRFWCNILQHSATRLVLAPAEPAPSNRPGG